MFPADHGPQGATGPPERGFTTLGVCVGNEAVVQATRDLAKAIGYRGIIDIGWRFDARDGSYKMLDLNPRLGATFRLFVGADGLDVVRALHLDLTGRPIPSDRAVEGRKWMTELYDARTSLILARRGELSAAGWMRSLSGVAETAWLAADDPLPAASLSLRVAGRLARRLVRRTEVPTRLGPISRGFAGAVSNAQGRFCIGCHHGALDPALARSAVVAIDVLRASTTAISAVAADRRCIPVSSLKGARERASELERPLLAGELGGLRPDGFDLQNSPVEVTAHPDPSRPLILLSTSGTPLMMAAATMTRTYVACLRNATAIARFMAAEHKRVAILGADPGGQLRREDKLCAARIGSILGAAGWAPEDAATEQILRAFADAPDMAILGGRSASYLGSTDQDHDLSFTREHIDDLQDAFVIDDSFELVRVT